MEKIINVLVVDDSIFMRKLITKILESDPEIKVAATANNGLEALDKIKNAQFDVVTLDINMPRMDGITALKHIMASSPMPVVMISALTQEGARETLDALSIGAVDFVAKASGSISFDIDQQRDEIVLKVKAAVKSRIRNLRRVRTVEQLIATPEAGARLPAGVLSKKGDRVIAIGASTGGPNTLFDLIPKLPKDLDASVFLIQHMPPIFTKNFATRLNDSSQIAVKEAADHEFVEKSRVYVAMGGNQLLVNKESGTNKRFLKIDSTTKATFTPNVNIAFNSIVETYAPNIIGVLLTGMGNDGAEGMLNIKKSGGVTIAEDESTAVIFGMPKAAINCGAADYILPSDKIVAKILYLMK